MNLDFVALEVVRLYVTRDAGVLLVPDALSSAARAYLIARFGEFPPPPDPPAFQSEGCAGFPKLCDAPAAPPFAEEADETPPAGLWPVGTVTFAQSAAWATDTAALPPPPPPPLVFPVGNRVRHKSTGLVARVRGSFSYGTGVPSVECEWMHYTSKAVATFPGDELELLPHAA